MPRPASEEVQQQWKERILSQRVSGLSVAAWCRQHNIACPAFQYWQDKLFPRKSIERSAFKEIVENQEDAFPKQTTGVLLKYMKVAIHLEKDFDPITLKQCLQILKESIC